MTRRRARDLRPGDVLRDGRVVESVTSPGLAIGLGYRVFVNFTRASEPDLWLRHIHLPVRKKVALRW